VKSQYKQVLLKLNGFKTSLLLFTFVKMGLSDALYQNPSTLEDLAWKVSIEKEPLLRFLRALSVLNLVSEEKELWSLTEEGALLAKDHPESMASLAEFLGSDWVIDAWRKLPKRLDGSAEAFDQFDYLESHPDEELHYQAAMAYYSKNSSKAILDEVDWSRFQTAVDVGGGHGGLLQAILERAPHLKATLFDQKNVIEQEKTLPILEGDFFAEVPPDFDLYLLRNVLQDWSDSKALEILSNISKAMKPDSTLMVFETLMHPDPERRLGKLADIHLFVTTPGGKIRSEEELKLLALRAGLEWHETLSTNASKSILLFLKRDKTC